ncbi:MAG: translation initiation factor IF-2, partial [Nitrospirae bacterium]|nr:translation initiation factor IF-2 [Nitrospirota bacterium]
MRKRVFELARELEMSSKELLVELKRMGAEAANHMIQLDDATVDQLMRRLGKAPKDASGHDPFAGLKPGKRILIKKAKPEPEAALEPETPAPAMDLEAVVEPSPVLEPAAVEAEPVFPESPLHAPVAVVSEAAVAPVPEPPPALVLPPPIPAPVVPIVAEAVKAGVKEKPKKGRKGGEEEPFGAHRWKDFKAIPKKEKRLRALAPERRGKGGLAGETTKPRKKVIRLHEGITVKEFAELIGVKGSEVIAKLMEMGTLCTINQPMDSDAAVLIADHFGLKVEMTLDRGEEEFEEMPDTEEVLSPRSPVVTVMGHVDHGKTSLLDAIRKTRVTEQESGGITQHIGAYSVRVNDRSVVFLDTPGHEAFTAMRARGAKVTDIVVLVVAADDGVMPQTVEAINHAKAAGVPIIVAINKIDKPDAAPERIRQELTKYELVPEAWGGQTIFSEVSAKKQVGLDHLLEMILLQADVLELKANPEKRARGAILEAKLDRGRGPVATVLVQSGTLRVGDPFVCGSHFGKVRMLINDAGKPVKEVPPSSPVEVIGLAGVPQAGDSFMVVEDEKTARTIASQRMQRQRMADMEKARKVT